MGPSVIEKWCFHLREDIMYRKCVCMAALCLTLAIAGNAAAQLGQGKVLFEYWDNAGGTSVDDDLRTLATSRTVPPPLNGGQLPEQVRPGRQLRPPCPGLRHSARVGRVHLLGRRR